VDAALLSQTLRAGQRAYGTAVLTASPFWPPYLQNTGLDFVFIDTEHVPLDRDNLSWMCRAYDSISLPPIVRIPDHDPHRACQTLDGGARGIVAPYIEHPDQLRPLIGATRHRPIKGQRLEAILRGDDSPEPKLKDYLHSRNHTNLLIANIESRPAMKNLDAILELDALDGVLIGPHDLSCSLGHPEDYDHPDFDQAVQTIIQTARAAGKCAGLHFVHGLERHLQLCRHGANLIIHSDCIHLISQTLRTDLQHLRQGLGDSTAAKVEVAATPTVV